LLDSLLQEGVFVVGWLGVLVAAGLIRSEI